MKITSSSLFFCLIFLSTTCIAEVNAYKHLDEVNRSINSGDCSGAESYAVRNITPPVTYTALGFVELDCRRDKQRAIGYFRLAASQGESVSAQILIRLGETPPEPQRVVEPQAQPRTLPSPPPFSLPPQQRVSPPQQITIQQEQVMPNPNTCIQDGGSLFCPNHPNTKIVPFNPFGH